MGKAPLTYSAAATARVISWRLRKNGYPMSKPGGDTEGYYAMRVGVSRHVSVDYRFPSLVFSEEQRRVYREKMDAVRKFLVEQGCTLDPNYEKYAYVHCTTH